MPIDNLQTHRRSIIGHSIFLFIKYFIQMKYLFSFSLIILCIVSCKGPSKNTMLLTAEVKGLRKGVLVLQKWNDSTLLPIDSVTVDGQDFFEFSATIEEPEIHYLTLRFTDSVSKELQLPFFAEAAPIHIATELENFDIQAKIAGSVNQQKIDEYKQLITRYRNRNLELIQERFNALKNNNDSMANAKEKQRESITRNTYLATVNFAINNSDFEVAPYLTLTEIYNANPKYLDTIYKSLTPKIKNSKYGKQLEFFIKSKMEK